MAFIPAPIALLLTNPLYQHWVILTCDMKMLTLHAHSHMPHASTPFT